jgi:dTDP-4-dehydrorhamnose reductase
VLPFEIWASPEPTVARIDASMVRDQLAETGHERRAGDIALLASLGIAATRYPVLWEKCATDDPARPDLAWPRARLEALREAGIEPVVTLLHHGSGPRWTSLVDPGFPEAFAAYAGAVARAFPWVRRWTPINEPLTTARFSTLYGHWYPNASDDRSFGRAIVNEARAMLLAMEAIRAVNPSAEFVVTEDLQSFAMYGDADRDLEAYVAHKRERMFLSLELVMGRVIEGHALYPYLVERAGIGAGELRDLAARAAAPDLVGWNYYPNSERLLERAHDGTIVNHARVALAPGTLDPRPLLRAAHARLDLPFGISEVHIDGDEVERVRWLVQRARDLDALARDGAPVRMLGAWAAFGMVDWRSLLRERDGYVEDGVFTFARADEAPRESAVAAAMRELARGSIPALPERAGWWETAGVPA